MADLAHVEKSRSSQIPAEFQADKPVPFDDSVDEATGAGDDDATASDFSIFFGL